MAKYTGVTQNTDGSWTYRIKIKLPDGSVKDTRNYKNIITKSLTQHKGK